MISEYMLELKDFFHDKSIHQKSVNFIYKNNERIKSLIDNILLEIPEYQTPFGVVFCILNNISLSRCKCCGKLLNYTQCIKNKSIYCSLKCVGKSSESKKKREDTNLSKYGETSILKTKKFKECSKAKIIEKYGVDNVAKSSLIKQKIKSTNIARYGVENASMSSVIKEKTKLNNLIKYGVEYPSQCEEVKDKIRNSIESRFGSKTYAESKESFSNSYDRMVGRFKEYVIPTFTKEEFFGYGGERYGSLYTWKCVKCGEEFEQYIYRTGIGENNHVPRCPKCYPALASKSNLEKELYLFIKEIFNGEIICNSRDIIKPYELDMYIPDLKIAIEFDGLYWHSEENVGSNYHLNKLNLCSANGIRLIHVFEDEWISKKDILKDRIKSIFGKFDRKIFARKCKVRELDFKTCFSFLDKNHIQGRDKSCFRYGLFYGEELVAVMTFGKPRFTTEYDFELIRYSSKLGVQVIGGAGKLLAYFENLNKGKTLISYADKRFSNGKLYFSLGFTFLRSSEPNYWWTKYQVRLSRYQCQKHKLKSILGDDFDVNESESVNMVRNGYHKIYDCGNLVFAKTME